MRIKPSISGCTISLEIVNLVLVCLLLIWLNSLACIYFVLLYLFWSLQLSVTIVVWINKINKYKLLTATTKKCTKKLPHCLWLIGETELSSITPRMFVMISINQIGFPIRRNCVYVILICKQRHRLETKLSTSSGIYAMFTIKYVKLIISTNVHASLAGDYGIQAPRRKVCSCSTQLYWRYAVIKWRIHTKDVEIGTYFCNWKLQPYASNTEVTCFHLNIKLTKKNLNI